MSPVLVTGGTGYVGTQLIAALLREGREVRTTVRSLEREPLVREAVSRGGADPSGLEVVAADLGSDDGWVAALTGVEELHHVATPFTTDVDTMVEVAREGTLRVLRAARDAEVRRVVITGSFAAIGYTPKDPPVYDESDWTDPDQPGLQTYPRSKTVAERAAWDFVAGTDLELVVLNPTAVFGPALSAQVGSTMNLVKLIMTNGTPVLPRARFGIADVRDVADLHVRAMATPSAAGKRYLVLGDGPAWSFVRVAAVIGEALGIDVPTEEAPGDDITPPTIRNDRAKAELGFAPRPVEETVVASATSLRELGIA